MATEPKTVEPEVSQTPVPKNISKTAPKPVYNQTVYVRMVDPHTALEYTQTPSELFKRTGWVESQLQAKKMELVDM